MPVKRLYAVFLIFILISCICGCARDEMNSKQTDGKTSTEYYYEFRDEYIGLLEPIIDMENDKMILEHLTTPEATKKMANMQESVSNYLRIIADSHEATDGSEEVNTQYLIDDLNNFINESMEKSDAELESGVSAFTWLLKIKIKVLKAQIETGHLK